jgi:hypothetical protein
MHIISLTVRKKMKMKKTRNKELKREKKEEAIRRTTKEQQLQEKTPRGKKCSSCNSLSLSLSLSLSPESHKLPNSSSTSVMEVDIPKQLRRKKGVRQNTPIQ